MTDPITDMLNRIRSAQAVFKETAVISFSNLKYEVAKILEREKFTGKVSKKGKNEKKILEISLKYHQDEVTKKKISPVISGMRRVSKPGQRIYTGAKEFKPVRGGYGMAIVSTSKGLMTDKEARNKRMGGEVLCEIW